jgi:hypothetical protein
VKLAVATQPAFEWAAAPDSGRQTSVCATANARPRRAHPSTGIPRFRPLIPTTRGRCHSSPHREIYSFERPDLDLVEQGQRVDRSEALDRCNP